MYNNKKDDEFDYMFNGYTLVILFVLGLATLFERKEEQKTTKQNPQVAVDMYSIQYQTIFKDDKEYKKLYDRISNRKEFEKPTLTPNAENILPERNQFLTDYKVVPILTNKPIVVAVIDTGISTKIKDIKQFIYNPENKPNFYGYDLTNKGIEDTHGHGTNVVGIMLNINPNIKILPLKYYNENGYSIKNAINSLRALDIAIKLNVDIISYSGGGGSYYVEEKKLLDEAMAKGITIVTALGNDGENINENPYFPASYGNSNIISVGNYDEINEKLSDRSNYSRSGNSIAYRGISIKAFGKTLTGTSQATAFITGAVSILKSYGYKDEKINEMLLRSADHKNIEIAYGVLNFTKLKANLSLNRSIASVTKQK